MLSGGQLNWDSIAGTARCGVDGNVNTVDVDYAGPTFGSAITNADHPKAEVTVTGHWDHASQDRFWIGATGNHPGKAPTVEYDGIAGGHRWDHQRFDERTIEKFRKASTRSARADRLDRDGDRVRLIWKIDRVEGSVGTWYKQHRFRTRPGG